MVCGDTYPPVLAFSFLDEIQKEFISTYDRAQVQTTQRPYKFIEFGKNISRILHHDLLRFLNKD